MIINKTVTPSELQLHDVVKVFGVTGYDTATVVMIDPDKVHLVRPYIHTDLLIEHEQTKRVIDYIGTERFFLWKSYDSHTVLLVERRQ